MIGKLERLFKCIFADDILMMILLPRAEFECSDAADALALFWFVPHKNVHTSYHAKVVI
ncbi:hypothetical protein [Bartonella pachyuromydis]|uniref:Uncharacterized protein n=1 Tax=Bartonella pachyuromydis TaxID=931097 RepID=A0ABP8VBC5_9HYPH